jgi:hypothetical protein
LSTAALGVPDDPDSCHHEVALDQPPARRSHALHPARAFERGDGVAEHQIHALLAMDGGEHRADLRTEDSGQRRAVGRQRGHLDTELAK